MAGDVERGARLAGIGADGLGHVVQPAGRVHRTGAEQHVIVAQHVLDRRDQLQPAALRADILACRHEGAGQQALAGELAVIARPLAQPGGVDRPCLGAQDDPVDAAEFVQGRKVHGANFRALGLQNA